MRIETWIAFARAAAVALAAAAATASAQTPTATVNVARPVVPVAPPGAAPKMVSPTNPWLAAQLAYKFSGTGDATDSFVVSARALHWLSDPEPADQTSGWGLPVMANFTGLTKSTPPEEIDAKLQEVAGTAQGMWVGVMPYWRWRKGDFVSPTLFLGLVPLKANVVRTTGDATERLYQGTATAGVELGIGVKSRSHLTVSASVTYAVPYDDDAFDRAFPGDEFERWSGELTTVLPLGNGLGLLAEGVFPQGADPGFRAGIVVSTDVGDEE